MKLHHGGRLHAAAEQFGIALNDWLDLSTAINPQAWPVPAIPDEVWRRLPEDEDGLLMAATHYYGAHPLLAVPGTQAVIEILPKLFTQRRVWVPEIGYQEHAYCWQKHGHSLIRYTHLPDTKTLLPNDIVVVINPNNPTAELHAPSRLKDLTTTLATLQGLLVVDEAFMDCTPHYSLLNDPLPAGRVVLRSFGKFFGLAGIRLGFCFAEPPLLQKIDEALGPWAVNHPARWIAERALRDTTWQQSARQTLATASNTLQHALQCIVLNRLPGDANVKATDLFVTLTLGSERAASLYTHLASQGVLTRRYADEGLIRMGVDAAYTHQQRLMDSFAHWVP